MSLPGQNLCTVKGYNKNVDIPASLLCSPITVFKSTDVISSFYIHYFKPQTTALKQTSVCLKQ